MSICCGDLLSLKYFKDITLVAGEKGLYRQITWPFICTTNTVSEWVNGGELLFLSGAGHRKDTESLMAIFRESVFNKVAGMVILTGKDYIPEIPRCLLELADKASFPIFQMPWNLKLINVTQEISEHITLQKSKQQKTQDFLERVLYSKEDSVRLAEIAPLYGVTVRPFAFIAILEVVSEDSLPDNLDLIKNDLARTMSSRCNSRTSTLISMERPDKVIFLVCADTRECADLQTETVSQAFRLLESRYKQLKLFLAFGQVASEHERIQRSLTEAERCLLFLVRRLCTQNIFHYSHMGIYKLFFQIENPQDIVNYYQENIGCLIESDRKTSSEFIVTLRCYLFNNCNLVKTAQALFIHRNTLVYRINAIEELLGKKLDDAFVRHELFNSILAIDFSSRLLGTKAGADAGSKSAPELV